jgi:hypothetical protein
VSPSTSTVALKAKCFGIWIWSFSSYLYLDIRKEASYKPEVWAEIHRALAPQFYFYFLNSPQYIRLGESHPSILARMTKCQSKFLRFMVNKIWLVFSSFIY